MRTVIHSRAPEREVQPETARAGLTLSGPSFRHVPSTLDVIHNQDEPMIVIAVENLDVHAGIGHPAREEPQLPRNALLQTHDHHLPHREHPDPGRFQRVTSDGTIREEEMRRAVGRFASSVAAVHDPRAAALDTYPSSPERPTLLGERAGPILEGNG